jgi:hypothetical protein
VDINAVEHGTRNPLLVAGHGLVGAGTGFFRISTISTGAGIHTSGMFFQGEHEVIVPLYLGQHPNVFRFEFGLDIDFVIRFYL